MPAQFDDDTVPRSLHLAQLARADRLQQELSRLRDELRSTKRELAAAREERDIAGRRAARAVHEKALECDPATLQWIEKMAHDGESELASATERMLKGVG